jgi:hypothetical protein
MPLPALRSSGCSPSRKRVKGLAKFADLREAQAESRDCVEA